MMVKGLVPVFMAALLPTACSRVPEHTLDPETLYQDFATYNVATVAVYRQKWEGNDLTDMDRAMLAGELIGRDPSRSAEYFAYLKATVHSKDSVIAETAANSLRNARGDEALDLLVTMATSSRPQVALAAVRSLDFKRQSVLGSRTNGHEADALNERIKELCARRSLAGYARQVVCRQEGASTR
jgi:HEAT repeat protein